MENYQMNRSGGRPYNRTCGMMNSPMPVRRERNDRRPCPCEKQEKRCDCVMPGTTSKDMEMYTHLQYLPAAMAYVPCQELTTTFELGYALSVGTIFPQLCKPFCGMRGGCK
ncbi:spore coat associated protein CotJA [Ruminococcus sp. 5_1_39BFAA]|uniref:spore coat associated protein CotJA n=1 Tax=Ruminococcus sp. 5_1_39BFAA TaxID=457412 RepID=UPI0035687961